MSFNTTNIEPITDPRFSVLVDMAYELGGAGIAGFTKFLAAYRRQAWGIAAFELKKSQLFEQVPNRVKQNIEILLEAKFPPGINCAFELIQSHEGCNLAAKPDAKGRWVIGWGHGIGAPESVPPTCTQSQADNWLTGDYTVAVERARLVLNGAIQ